MSLLGDKAAEIACRVILSAKKWSKKASDCLKVLDSDSWWLKSHFVEYGVVGDSKGNGVHEVNIGKLSNFL